MVFLGENSYFPLENKRIVSIYFHISAECSDNMRPGIIIVT